MSRVKYGPRALAALDEIYRYTSRTWGRAQSDTYLDGLFSLCRQLQDRAHRPIPAGYGVEGFVTPYRRHLIYWRTSADGVVFVAHVLHERMNQGDRLAELGEGADE